MINKLSLLFLLTISLSRASFAQSNEVYRLYGYVVDGATLQPLAGATVKDQLSNTEAVTDEHGYYTLKLPAPGRTETLKAHLLVSKDEYKNLDDIFSATLSEEGQKNGWGAQLQFLGLAGHGGNKYSFSNSSELTPSQEEDFQREGSPSRAEAFEKFLKEATGNGSTFLKNAFEAAPDQIYFVINGKAYVSYSRYPNVAYMSFDTTAHLLVNGKTEMTGDEVNRRYKRSQISGRESRYMNADKAEKQFGIHRDLLVIYFETQL
ncbi:peptidase associated/transthyretin-like domain-containing protein [Dinghuibacter silviterrae]|uniref:Carboxypeptidase-like protein n=1 Tax=Dinghuibacter silviterrae TaxID=1539049 RepID=A0A4R8DG25_9BACT|nr:hypothetical protein [Dinghuibacter silviterrae]TDW96056.1 hypothetical protein EDB95_3878 [Dinghuibacter silviterrae]